VTGGAAVGESGDDRGVALDVAFAISGSRAHALRLSELALEDLAAAHDGAEWIARDQKTRGVGGEPVTAAGADLLLQRLVNPGIERVGCLVMSLS
jgi:hypothetical protein